MAIKDRLYDVPVVGTALRVQDRYVDDAGDQLAAAIGFFGFLSLFPILVLAFAVLGFFFRDDPALQQAVVDGVGNAVPGFQQMLDGENGVRALMDGVERNAGAIGLAGLATVLLTGLRVVNAAMVATTRIFRIELPTGVKVKVRQVLVLVGLGLLTMGGAVASGAAAIDVAFLPSWATALLGFGVSLVIDILTFLIAYRVLAATDGPGWRQLWPGAVLTGTAWAVLKVFSSTVVAGQIAKANELYGAFASLIALMLLLYLAGRLYVYGAELSAVIRHPETAGDGPDDGPEDPDAGPDDEAAAIADEATYAAVASEAEAPGTGSRGTGSRGTGSRAGAERDRATERDEDGRPPVLTPDERSPTVSRATADRIATADRSREGATTPVRPALAFAIAIGAVGALAGVLKPWQQDGE